jgi:hypothetical protein
MNVANVQRPSALRSFDGWILCGYLVLPVLAVAALYLPFSGLGLTDPEIVIATVLR